MAFCKYRDKQITYDPLVVRSAYFFSFLINRNFDFFSCCSHSLSVIFSIFIFSNPEFITDCNHVFRTKKSIFHCFFITGHSYPMKAIKPPDL